MKNGGIRLPSRYFENKPTKPCRLRRLIFDQAVGNTKCNKYILLQTKARAPTFRFALEELLLTFQLNRPALVPLFQLPPTRATLHLVSPACNANFEIASHLSLYLFFVVPSILLRILLFIRSNSAKGRGLGTPGPPL